MGVGGDRDILHDRGPSVRVQDQPLRLELAVRRRRGQELGWLAGYSRKWYDVGAQVWVFYLWSIIFFYFKHKIFLILVLKKHFFPIILLIYIVYLLFLLKLLN